jgi:hypothetical protein
VDGGIDVGLRGQGRGNDASCLGFSGGGFDRMVLFDRVREGDVSSDLNALAIDSIEMRRVPEPSTLLLLGLGLAGRPVARRRKSKQ